MTCERHELYPPVPTWWGILVVSAPGGWPWRPDAMELPYMSASTHQPKLSSPSFDCTYTTTVDQAPGL